MNAVQNPRYVRSPEPVAVLVETPTGRHPGSVEGYAGSRVYATWSEGLGLRYFSWLPAVKVERVENLGTTRPRLALWPSDLPG